MGVGYYDLAKYLQAKYGRNSLPSVMTGDPMSLYLFYPGKVIPFSVSALEKETNLLVLSNNEELLKKYNYKITDFFYLKGEKLFTIWSR